MVELKRHLGVDEDNAESFNETGFTASPSIRVDFR